MRGLRLLLIVLAAVLLLLLLVLGASVAALNTATGRAFAVQEINAVFAPRVQITGLAGHFPADLKLASLTLADRDGVWLSGQGLELRWRPLALLRGEVVVTALTAASLDVARQPTAGEGTTASSPRLPNLRLDIDHLAVPTLTLGAAIAGEKTALNVSGAAHWRSATQGDAHLTATAQHGGAQYALDAAIDRKTVSLRLHAAEPPNGPLGHFAGPQVSAPLTLDVALSGPRDDAALSFSAALGAAQLQGSGTLDLNPDRPNADVTMHIPALAPFGALLGKNLAGTTSLHLMVATQRNGSARLTLSGDVALTGAPYGLVKLVGPAGHFALLAALRGKAVEIEQLDVSGAAFAFSATGRIAPSATGRLAPSAIDLTTQTSLRPLSAFSPALSGEITERGTLDGTPGDFAVNAVLTGDVAEKNIPSAPFTITLAAQHLPQAPEGTLTGSGMLENAPLLLDAAFSRNAQGTATLTLNKLLWRSLNAQANLVQTPGNALPAGTAKFSATRLEDFALLSPVPLRGSVQGSFARSANNTLHLDLAAKNLSLGAQLGAVNATLSAAGPADALHVRAQALADRRRSTPARLALAGVVNLGTQSAALTALSASWQQVTLALQAPAQLALRPDLTVRHLALNVNGGQVALDGTLSPALHATLKVQNLPASLIHPFAPTMTATGTISATAALTGSIAAPRGRLTFDAQNIQLHSGPASALPAADLTGSAALSGQTAQIDAKLAAGPDIALTAAGQVPLQSGGALNLHVAGRADLRLLNPILAAAETAIHGELTTDIQMTGTPAAPRVNGSASLADGSVENINTGLNLTHIAAYAQAAGRVITLQSFQADAGKGRMTGHGEIDLGTPDLPFSLAINAVKATPISSDIVTGNLDAALTLTGALRGAMALAGTVKINQANLNIPQSLPPSVADLPILNAGENPPPPPPPPLPVSLDLLVTAKNQIFVRGDGIFAELSGRVHLTGTAASPTPQGGFGLIRGYVSLGGKTLQFTSGSVSFNGAGFMPTLDLEASAVTANNSSATLIVGGTAAKPVITLTSSPPLPSDEILAQLLFGQSATSLSPFQAASLAAALAQLSGVGGGLPNPLDAVRNALGLSQLSLGGSGSGAPALEAGRYVAPGVYVGATQATNGQGTQATVEINLYKGLKLQSATGSSSTGNSSSVGLSYQFNY
jgi:autotransporter translocation and assembly factor TamB